jgi:hypothetical protein
MGGGETNTNKSSRDFYTHSRCGFCSSALKFNCALGGIFPPFKLAQG